MGQMRADWASLSSSVRLALLTDVANVLDEMSETQFCTSLYSLGKMGVLWRSLPRNLTRRLLQRLHAAAAELNEQQVMTCFPHTHTY